MIDTTNKPGTIPGFSERFRELLERANFPQQGRYSRGSDRFNVNVNTFSTWCQSDLPPRTYPRLVEIVEDLLTDIPGDYDPRSVASWLQSGMFNPLEEHDMDCATIGEIWVVLLAEQEKRGMQLETDAANSLTHKVYHYITEQQRKGEAINDIRNSEAVKTIISSKLDLITYGIDS